MRGSALFYPMEFESCLTNLLEIEVKEESNDEYSISRFGTDDKNANENRSTVYKLMTQKCAS